MRSRLIVVAFAAALSSAALRMHAHTAPTLGSAASFTVLGGSSVTNTGPTIIAGNVGVSPGNTVTGLTGSNFVVGEIRRNDALARQAQQDSAAASRDLASGECIQLTTLEDAVLLPKVYCVSSATLSRTLTLDGPKDGVWIFRIAGNLTMSDRSAVVAINGGVDRNVFWQVGGSASLGAGSTFLGSVLALDNITVNRGATVSGRLLAQRGTVSLDTAKISVCCEPFSFSRSAFPDGRVGTAYSETTAVTGGFGPYMFVISAGSLPPPMTLSSGGVLSGTPRAAGTYSFSITATDAQGCSGTRVYEITVAPCPIVITSPAPRGAIVGTFYRHDFMATGGTAPYTFTVPPDVLPEGLKPINNGIEGIPLRPGCRTFTVTVTDAAGCTGTQTVTLCVVCGTLVIGPPAMPDGLVNVAYSAQLNGSGGSGQYTFERTGEVMPDGIAPPTPGGVITGVPSKPGCFTFTVTMTDVVSGCTVTKTYTICIQCTKLIVITPPQLPNGTIGVLYEQQFGATGGTPPYTFSAPKETLPDGIPLDGDTLRLVPRTKKCFTFTVTVTDSAGCVASRTYTVCFDYFDCPAATISPAALPLGIVNTPYPDGVKLSVSPGTGFTFERPVGLPPGMDLLPDGELTDMPHVTGTFTFTVTATSGDCKATRDYTIVIIPVFPPTVGNAPLLSLWGTMFLALLLGVAGVIVIREIRS